MFLKELWPPVVPPDLAFPRSGADGRSHTTHSIFVPSRCEWQAPIWCKLVQGELDGVS